MTSFWCWVFGHREDPWAYRAVYCLRCEQYLRSTENSGKVT